MIGVRVAHPALERRAADVAAIVERALGEHDTTRAIAERLCALLAHDREFLPPAYVRPDRPQGALYPVCVADDGSFSIASTVCNPGRATPIHDHGFWGVIGVYSGVEHERRYNPPELFGETPPVLCDERLRGAEAVTICCTTDQDLHDVGCGSDEPYVGIQIYGADIGAAERHAFDPQTGAVQTFVSDWDSPQQDAPR